MHRAGALLIAALALAAGAAAAQSPPAAAVASAHPLATEAGAEILQRGGNAFDAAVAVAAALGVVEPHNSGLGGGGFFLLHRAADGRQIVIDARETAPLAAHRDMYLDANGQVVPGKSLDGPLAAAAPGLPAALAHLAAHYGRLPLSATLAPAIRLAREGVPVSELYRQRAQFRLAALRASPDAARIFLLDGEVPSLGHKFVQPELAATLDVIAAEGATAFYQGERAQAMVQAVRAAGGIWSTEDLAAYRVIERTPLSGDYRGIRVVTVPPPSSGGVVLIEALNMLERHDLAALDRITHRHLIVEVLRRAYRDRALYLGDPDFVSVPVGDLIDKSHAARLAASIHMDRATPSATLAAPAPAAKAGHTTHFSILDAEGNRVAATLSLNTPFGCGFVVPGTGVLLNNEMDDFSAKPGAANAYGLVGAGANAIAPGKRPLSSMTPTFLETADRVGILGTPGGPRIISMVLLAVLEFAAGGAPEQCVGAPRYHHQYLPDVLELEPGAFNEIEQAGLKRLGHTLREQDRPWGNMQAIIWDRRDHRVQAASDPRGEGAAVVLGD